MPSSINFGSLRRRVQIHELHDRGVPVEDISSEVGVDVRVVRAYLSRIKPKMLPIAELRDAHWMDDAVCREEDIGLFYPTVQGTKCVELKARAKKLCSGCPVAEKCLRYAESNYEGFGVWGGVDFTNFVYHFDEQTGEIIRKTRGRYGQVKKVS